MPENLTSTCTPQDRCKAMLIAHSHHDSQCHDSRQQDNLFRPFSQFFLLQMFACNNAKPSEHMQNVLHYKALLEHKATWSKTEIEED